jgi:hypothetical protein
MKYSHLVLFSICISILISCGNNPKKSDSKAIVGIWQNTTNPNAAIEFTMDGEYYLRLNGARLLPNDSTVEKYSYDPLSEGNNLIIYGNPRTSNTQAKIKFMKSEQMKISLVSQGKIISEANFTKVKEQ